jgi:hypothetical protein
MALDSRRLPSLLRVPASPVPRPPRYYEGATTSHPRIRGRLLFSLPRSTRSSCFVLAARSRETGGFSRARTLLVAGCPNLRLSRVDANGISQVFRQSIPCLCSALRPRSGRRVLACCGRSGAAPATHTTKAPTMPDFGAQSPSFGTCSVLRFAPTLPLTRKARFRLAGCASAGRESNPLDCYERFQFVFDVHPPFLLS